MFGVVLAAVAGFLAYTLLPMRSADTATEIGPCDREATGLAVFLFDFRKPLVGDGFPEWMPGAILRESALALPAGTELHVYTLARQPTVPLAQVGRLCKPAGAPGGSGRVDCAARPRPGADGDAFCERLSAVQRQVDNLADVVPELPVPSAHLVEAIEDVRLVFAGHPGTGRRSFYLLSDMIQHAAWFSHLAPDGSLRLGSLDELRVGGTVVGTARAGAHGVAAEVFYVPRRGVTEPAARREAHQRLWAQYFATTGMAVVFRNLSALPRYLAGPPADHVTSLTRVLRQRELLRREQEEGARIQALVAARGTELERERQSAAAADRRFEEMEQRLLAEEADERAGIAAERAAIRELQAELARRAGS